MTEIPWNKVFYIDCLDKEKGLPSLPDKCIDLGYSDPPWGVELDKLANNKDYTYKGGKKLQKEKQKVQYNDSISYDWYLQWFNELRRVCNRIILVVGQKHLKFWYNQDPTGQLIIHQINSVSRDNKIASWNHYTPYLYWGKFKKKLIGNVIDYVIPWGFLSDNHKWVHPSPKGTEVAKLVFNKLEPTSIIDPFLGSGSYAQAAQELGIKWLGYEINKDYSIDIEFRLKNCKKEPKQQSILTSYGGVKTV